ncbi:helix-turn-helix domain-containing protein [Streptomyces sp. 6N223]|uniref:helix-turn-helix domain-containing protein n=1 Tax=Streptomyces sp. 6N223 TaxID=3457412 RepID=UPI003FCEFA68
MGRLDELLRELGRQASRGPEPDLRPFLDWLHRQIGADIALIGGTVGAPAVEVSTAGFPQDVLAPLAPVLARLSGGQIATAATQAGAWQVRCEALGPGGPRPVLVVAGPAALTPEAASLASHVGSVVALLRRAREADTTSRGYQHKARQMRFAVLSALMTGDVTLARRITTGDVPTLLDADRVRVHVLHCTPSDRDRLAKTYQDPSGYHGRDMLVHCPHYAEHLICLIPDGTEDTRTGCGEALRHLVRENPHYALGISDPHPLAATAEAYGHALHALAVARNTPDRVATYHGQAPLAKLLPRPESVTWARAFLRPLHAAPKLTVDITRLAVALPSRSGVARLLGISRNTVTTHVRRAATMLGLDLNDTRARAAVDLALTITSPQPDAELPALSLDMLLHTPPATTWAQTFLRPVQDTRRPAVHATLRAWIDVNTDAQRTAARLGISRNTVRAHLRAAERLLARDLLTTGTGIHDLVHALHSTDGFPHPA